MVSFGVSNQKVGQVEEQQENAAQYIDVLGKKVPTAFVEKYLYQSYPLRVDWSVDDRWEQSFHRCSKEKAGARLSNLQRVLEVEMTMDGSFFVVMVEGGERKLVAEGGPVVGKDIRPFPTKAQYEGGRSEARWSGDPDKTPQAALEEWLEHYEAEVAAAAKPAPQEARASFAQSFGNTLAVLYGSCKPRA